jgi:hypothetical protein
VTLCRFDTDRGPQNSGAVTSSAPWLQASSSQDECNEVSHGGDSADIWQIAVRDDQHSASHPPTFTLCVECGQADGRELFIEEFLNQESKRPKVFAVTRW